MIHKMYAVFDSAAKFYHMPFYQKTEAEARRTFTSWCNDPKTPYNVNPDDYTLFALGEWDDQSGTLHSLDTPIALVKANALKV